MDKLLLGSLFWPVTWPRRPVRRRPSSRCWPACWGQGRSNTLEVLNTAVSVRWSRTGDLIDAIEHIARLALLVRAERENKAEEVAEQLFRFDRVLTTEPRLTALLSDFSRPGEGGSAAAQRARPGRRGQPDGLGAAGADRRLTAGERADDAVEDLAELAVAHRGEIVAEVAAAADLTDAQRRRLTAVLTRIYHHPVSVQLNVEPELLGGSSVAVGDEVIDGTLSSRLTAAAIKLPD